MADVPIFIILGVIAAVAIGAAQKGRTQDSWADAARQLGMTLKPATFLGYPSLSGQFGDVVVNVSVYSTGGKNSQRYTRYEVRHPPAGPAVTLTKQGIMSGFFGAFTGRRDVLIGDPLFDDGIVVDSDDEDAVREFLTPARRAAVQEVMSVFAKAEISRDSITASNRGVTSDSHTLVSTITWLVHMASVLGDVRFNAILGHQQAGHLRQAAEELHEYNRCRENRFTSTLEAEAMVESGNHVQAAEAFNELWRGTPVEPVAKGWHGVATTPDPPPVVAIPPPRPEDAVDPAIAPPPPSASAPPPPPTPPPPPPAPAPVAPATPAAAQIGPASQDAVLADIFHTNRMSWEVAEHFEASHRNTAVEWSGTVASFDPYERDRDFDGGPGVKAIVLVGHIGRPGIISNEIHAVVELEPGVRLRDGQSIRFHGVLSNVDRFGRKVWVRHATLR